MITLRTIAWQFLDDISGGGVTKDTRFDEREIILKIRQLLNEVLMLSVFQKAQEGDRSAITTYISRYELLVVVDKEKAYVTIPEFFTGQAYNRGIHRIFLKRDPYKDFIISHNPGVSKNLGAGNVYGENYVFIEGYTMIFRNLKLPKSPTALDKTVVLQLIIAAPDSIGINDILPVLPEHQTEILKRLKAQYIPTPQDPTNNNNKDI
jgi:hypothetical protein